MCYIVLCCIILHQLSSDFYLDGASGPADNLKVVFFCVSAPCIG
jgi:hypothetical protein